MPNIQTFGPPVSPAVAPDMPHATVLSERHATQGFKTGHMRYVLGIGLALSVGAGVLLAIFH